MLRRLVHETLARTFGGSIDDYNGLSVGSKPPPCHEFALDYPRPGADWAAQLREADPVKQLALGHVFPAGTEVLAFFSDSESPAPTPPPAPYESELACPSDWLGPLGSPSVFTYTRLEMGAPGLDAWLAARHFTGDFLHPSEATMVRVHHFRVEVYGRRSDAALGRLLAPAIAAYQARFRAG